MSTGATREILRKKNQKDTLEHRVKDKIVEMHTTGHQRAEESMLLQSKAELMAQSMDSGTIDQVKEQLTLLAQFKESFVKVRNGIDRKGEETFDQNVNELLSELPFMKKRRIICDGVESEISNLGDTPTTKSNNK
jgi:hypothetical protein